MQAGASVRLADNGVHTVEFWSADRAGNCEDVHHVQVRADKVAPTIATKLPAANSAGWHNADVTVTVECADQAGEQVTGAKGPGSSEPGPFVVVAGDCPAAHASAFRPVLQPILSAASVNLQSPLLPSDSRQT